MSKIIINIGITASIIGGIITGYSTSKYNEAKSMLNALHSGDKLFGTYSGDAIKIWTNHSDNYKIMVIIGAVILAVGVILLISGLITASGNKNQKEVVDDLDIAERLKQLENLKANELISEDEFMEKRKELLNKI